jgi:UDP-N-acetylglucosamine transferase subunit ALG13
MELTESQRVVFDWLQGQAQRAVREQVKHIVENAVIQAAHGDPKPLAMLRRVAEFDAPVTNYLGDLRRELAAAAEGGK